MIHCADDNNREDPDAAKSGDEKLEAVKEIIALSAYLYGPSHGRGLWNMLWDIARTVATEEWVERLGDDPQGLCCEAGYIQDRE